MTGNENRGELDCGKTIEELSNYVESGRIPRDPHIESCPDCPNAVEALEHLGKLSRELLKVDAATAPVPPAGWLDRIVNAVRSEMRTGRSLPISHPDPRVAITVTEGAVRALLRAVGDAMDGVIIGRTEIIGDAETPNAPVRIRITASVAWGEQIAPVTASLRQRVCEALAGHTELNVEAVDVTVEDIHGYRATGGHA